MPFEYVTRAFKLERPYSKEEIVIDEITRWLNEQATQGWRLSSSTTIPFQEYGVTVLFLEREVK